MSYVVPFGSETLDGVWNIVEFFTQSDRIEWVRVLAEGVCESFEYQETKAPLGEIKESLRAREIVSVQCEQRPPDKMLLGLYAPRFCGSRLQQWLCVMEGTEKSALAWFDHCYREPNMDFVAICVDEYPDFEAECITAATFPWDDWRLMRAAARRLDRSWEERTKFAP